MLTIYYIPGYSHKYCIRTNVKIGRGVSLYNLLLINLYLIKLGKKLSFQSNDFEIIEFDKNVFPARKTLL